MDHFEILYKTCKTYLPIFTDKLYLTVSIQLFDIDMNGTIRTNVALSIKSSFIIFTEYLGHNTQLCASISSSEILPVKNSFSLVKIFIDKHLKKRDYSVF